MSMHEGVGVRPMDRALTRYLRSHPYQIKFLFEATCNPDTWVTLDQDYTRWEHVKKFFGIPFAPQRPRSQIMWLSRGRWFEFRILSKYSNAA